MKDNIEVLISEQDVRNRIREMADEISEQYRGKEVVLIGILNGSVFFMTELAQHLSIPLEMDFMAASSYVGTDSTGKVLVTKDLERSIEGRDVLIVEDIVDSGVTLHYLKQHLNGRGAASIRIATLLDKPARRRVDLKTDYSCFEIPDAFVVGYGLDYDEKYRNLPDIGVLVPRIYENEGK